MDSNTSRHPRDAQTRLPASYAVRWAISRLGMTNQEFAFAAALGVSWYGVGRIRATWTPADPASYGAAVIDELVERDGVAMVDVIQAGAKAYLEIVQSIVSEGEVETAEGNSEAVQEAASSA